MRKVPPMPFYISEDAIKALLVDLKDNGWHSSANLVPLSISDQLLSQLIEKKRVSALVPARIGQGLQKKIRPDIRGDSILWLDRQSNISAEQDFFLWLDGFKKILNENLMLGLEKEEMHYALYPPGTGYKKHVDCFEKNDQRVLSFVLYLNKNWQESDGGQIALFNESNPEQEDARISPTYGQCVIFLSASIYHEVNFTRAERFSVTGWLKKAAPSADSRVFEP
jgi:SM-20-related protein